MTFRETFYNVKELLENRLHDFGLESADASTMGWTTMLSIEQNTRVTIDVPLNLIYSDAFLITGTLETSTYSRLNSKTVKLKVGNTVVDTTTTNVNGEYSFTQTPVSTGTHSFQVIFEGTNIHAASESSIVTRTPNKETSVINLDTQSTKHYGDNVILSGTLLTDDGEYIKNASVKYYINNSLINTLTTDNYGVFTTPTRTINSFNNLNAQFVYEGDSNYTSVSANQIVDVYQPNLNLTSDKDILSYADNESAIITAQLIDDAPIPQELEIPNYDIIFSIPTDYTDISNIPTQYDSFIISFKATEGTFDIVGEPESYEKATVIIPSNNASQFELVWTGSGSGDSMRLYQDGNYLRDNVVHMLSTPSLGLYDFYQGDYANFENNDGITFSDICIEYSEKTDNTGKATFTYNSQGVGDIEIGAHISGRLLIETYVIKDYYKIGFNNINFELFSSDRTVNNIVYNDDDSITVTSRSGGGLKSNVIFSGNDLWECSFDVEYHSLSAMRLGIQSVNATSLESGIAYETSDWYSSPRTYINSNKNLNGGTTKLNEESISLPRPKINFKIVCTSNTSVNIYVDDVLKQSISGYSWLMDDLQLIIHSWDGSGTVTYSNFKITQL